MNLEVQKAISNLDSITLIEDPNELQRLDDAVQELLASENAELGLDALLRVLERFPNKDGYGIFWGILHGVEGFPDYEERLIESVRRQPSEFSLLMINRMLNTGMKEVKGINLLSVLKDVAMDERQPEELRKEARGFVEWQESER
jgi:hypothetical protein